MISPVNQSLSLITFSWLLDWFTFLRPVAHGERKRLPKISEFLSAVSFLLQRLSHVSWLLFDCRARKEINKLMPDSSRNVGKVCPPSAGNEENEGRLLSARCHVYSFRILDRQAFLFQLFYGPDVWKILLFLQPTAQQSPKSNQETGKLLFGLLLTSYRWRTVG